MLTRKTTKQQKQKNKKTNVLETKKGADDKGRKAHYAIDKKDLVIIAASIYLLWRGSIVDNCCSFCLMECFQTHTQWGFSGVTIM